jgi:hypothetical protein
VAIICGFLEAKVKSRAVAWAGVFTVCTIVALRADTLVLKDGRRIDGLLVGARDGVIEFERVRPQGGRERVSIDRVDVVRIEIDEGTHATNAPSLPAGAHTRDVIVDARTAWTDVGIDVAVGQLLSFYATDRIRWAPGRRDGPDGEHNSPPGPGRPAPNERRAALIGRIGEGRTYFLVGSRREGIRMPAAGRLFLGINDDSLEDNAGSFRVTIHY